MTNFGEGLDKDRQEARSGDYPGLPAIDFFRLLEPTLGPFNRERGIPLPWLNGAHIPAPIPAIPGVKRKCNGH